MIIDLKWHFCKKMCKYRNQRDYAGEDTVPRYEPPCNWDSKSYCYVKEFADYIIENLSK